jgi:inosine-uridine nucleoside N-ribohydrolase
MSGFFRAWLFLVLVCSVGAPFNTLSQQARLAPVVIVTTDIGAEIDDQWTLTYLLLLNDDSIIDLRGIITTHAPTLAEPASRTAAQVARRVMNEFVPRYRPRIIEGRAGPLNDLEKPSGLEAFQFINETAEGLSKGRRLTILSFGAATDIATAISLNPELTNRLDIIAMAFERWPTGGDSWNVKNDRAAFDVILRSGVPLTIGGARVCIRHLSLRADDAARILNDCGPPGDYLASLYTRWLQKEQPLCYRTTGEAAWPIWDMVTVAHLLKKTYAEERPRPGLRKDLAFDLSEPKGTVRWITNIDEKWIWDDFRKRLRRRVGR